MLSQQTKTTEIKKDLKETDVGSISQQICLDLLVSGNVNSYVEFFHLAIQQKDVKADDESSEKLLQLKSLLMESENNKRKGNARAAYDSKINIAKYFESSNLMDISEKHYKEALDIAKMLPSSEFIVEIEANLNYGVFLEHTDMNDEALSFFEQARSLSKSSNSADIEMRAARNVVGVRIKMAEKLERQDLSNESIAHYAKCMEVLQQASLNLTESDKSLLLDLHFRLGKSQQAIGDIDSAIKSLNYFLEICKKSGDRTREGWAKVILAACYERSNDIGLAISYLQQFLSAAEGDSTLKMASSQACNQLGRLFHKVGNFKESVQYYEQHYKLTVELDKEAMTLVAKNQGATGTKAAAAHHSEESSTDGHFAALASDSTALDIRLASIQLGAARADMQMDDLFKQVCDQSVAGIQPLLQWKCSRVKNPNILRPAAAAAAAAVTTTTTLTPTNNL